MSIAVTSITKRYGDQVAVGDVSFRVSTGEVVGFIGPNGAGKSTTMKIITGTLRPEAGEVKIQGVPVHQHLRKVRQMIGYLPENNPLYPDMYIREYLGYVAGLYGIRGRSGKKRVEEVASLTGLMPEIHKKISQLSKGYRQRVGLAQALVHQPPILILDEPTSGLDPNQLGEIRSLIAAIGKERTVLLSTHILQEVEAICDRVVVIHSGSIVADENAASIKGPAGRQIQTIHLELDGNADPATWKSLPFIRNVKSLDNNQLLLEVREPGDKRAEVFKHAVNQNLTILSLTQREKSLEEVFRELTNGK